MKMSQSRALGSLVVVALVLAGFAMPAQAKKKDDTAQKMIKQIEEQIKGYEVKLKSAQERMKAANEAGEEIQPLIKPMEKQMREWKNAMEAEQRKRAAASELVQEQIKIDEQIKQVRIAEEQAEDKRDAVMAKLMPEIEAEAEYKKHAANLDAAQQGLEKAKREKRQEDVPYYATVLAREQGALGTFVQQKLKVNKQYKDAADALDDAQTKRRETEKAVSERYRRESGLDKIDAMLEERQKAYRESRDKLHDLERKLKRLRSDYKDAEKDADWAAQRIRLRKNRIEAIKR